MPHGHSRTSRPGLLRAAGLFLLLFVAACGYAPVGGVPARALDPMVDGAAAAELLDAIAGSARLAGTPAFDDALEAIAVRLDRGGFTRLATLPPDGPPPANVAGAYQFVISDSLPYEVWQGTSARLEILGAEPFTAADTRVSPMALALNSRQTPRDGLVTRMVNLGNGTFDQEYEGVDVRGAIVYGRRPLMAIYRAAVVARGAAGVVSPAAPGWQGTDDNRELVAAGRVGRQGFGFKISPRMAQVVEAAMAAAGGAVRVRATVRSELLRDRSLHTLLAEIPGRDPTPERVLLIAPISGPAPGAGDVAGGAALLEVALALNRAVAEGTLQRPRRSILFMWGAAMQGTSSWMRRFPVIMEQLHSATVLQLLGTDDGVEGPPVLLERLPDPAAMWTRPPFSHTPWGAARPPHWPFEGHYLSDLTEALARSAAAPDTLLQIGSHPFEGASDHVPLLERRIPAQRLWHFPDPFYRSSLDLPEHIRIESLRRGALLAAVLAWELAEADVRTARKILKLIEAKARGRMATVLEAAAANLEGSDSREEPTGDRRLEERIANAWKIWYLEALESVMAHPTGTRANELKGAVNLAVARLNREWDAAMFELGLTLLPLPERFGIRRSVVR